MENCNNSCFNQQIEEKSKKHPCFSESGHLKYARMHLPIAPKCNIQCNYCNRKYDCLNESRPGVTSEILTPTEAFQKFLVVKEKVENLSVIGIAGPGDALANFDKVKETVELIKQNDPDITFCLSTNGLRLPEFAQEIIDIGISHITVTINSVNPEIGKHIYSGVDSEILLKNQLAGLEYLSSRGIICKVNIVAIKGINDFHIEEVVKTVKKLGAFKTNIMQLIPAKDTKFQDMPLVSNKDLNEIRKKCSVHLTQMYHCQQCRADAIGLLKQDRSIEFRNIGISSKTEKSIKDKEYRIAVASESGNIIDQHFGQAKDFTIYKVFGNERKIIDKRSINQYCTSKEECEEKSDKIDTIIDVLKDCNAILSLRIGSSPKEKLENNKIKTFEIYDTVENGISLALKQLAKY